MQPAEGKTVQVTAPAPAMSAYDVAIGAGILSRLGEFAAHAAPAARYAVLAPDRVAALYGDAAVAALRAAGLDAELLAFADGEVHKTRETWTALTDGMLHRGFGRDSCVVALGGGVAGDVAGFVAATYMRGVPVVQVPTTLLAMLDASVGGKTGVDTAAGKNLVGSFHPPRLVLMDTAVLATLPPAELRSGLAEAVKHGAIMDAAYFDWIGANASAILAGDAAALERLVARSVEIKAAVVAEDPLEQGVRAVLNFGHTVGHALERASGFTMLHGEAVSLGMVAEAAAGEEAGVTERGTLQRLEEALRRCELPVSTDPGPVAGLVDGMRLDKKARSGAPRLALLRRIGESARHGDGGWTHPLPESTLAGALRRLAVSADAV